MMIELSPGISLEDYVSFLTYVKNMTALSHLEGEYVYEFVIQHLRGDDNARQKELYESLKKTGISNNHIECSISGSNLNVSPLLRISSVGRCYLKEQSNEKDYS